MFIHLEIAMDELEVAKQRLKDKNLNLVFIRDYEPIFETKKEGLSGLLQAIEKLNGDLSNTSVADRIIGKAAALIYDYLKVKAAFAITLSQDGLEILNTSRIRCEFEKLVPTILNMKKTDKCPFEKIVENISNSKEAYKKIKESCSPIDRPIQDDKP